MKYYRLLRIKLYRVLHEKKSAHSISMGIALGVGFGMGPTPGLQMLPAIFIAGKKGYSVLAATLFVFVNNPITIVPIYIMNTYVGYSIVKNFSDVSWAEIKRTAADIQLETLLGLGSNFLISFFLGGIIVGIVYGIAAYFIALPLVRRIRK